MFKVTQPTHGRAGTQTDSPSSKGMSVSTMHRSPGDHTTKATRPGTKAGRPPGSQQKARAWDWQRRKSASEVKSSLKISSVSHCHLTSCWECYSSQVKSEFFLKTIQGLEQMRHCRQTQMRTSKYSLFFRGEESSPLAFFLHEACFAR